MSSLRVEKMFKIELQPGDRVVTTTQIRDYVIVVTERGDVFRITVMSGG
jgi:hypothetical protein